VYLAEVGSSKGKRAVMKAVEALYEGAGVSKIIGERDLVAIKLHVGERHNTTHVKPQLIRAIVSKVKERGAQPFLTDTSTLYSGNRDNAVKHALLAHGHGFSVEGTGAPFIPVDGLTGNAEAEVLINGVIHEKVKVAREIKVADSLIVVSHATGHMGTGLGGCIKNLGMGLTSKAGKMRQHSSIRPEVITERCRNCKKCRRWCPVDAITQRDQRSLIMEDRCIGCGECLAVCRHDAIRYDFGVGSERLQRSMAEHAWGSIKDKAGKVFFINVLLEMTANCDCFPTPQSPIMEDIGVIGSFDPVAIDMATLDLTRERAGTDLARLSHPNLDPMIQILHAKELGMGSTEYLIKKIEWETEDRIERKAKRNP
jgi:hypothetical protein